MVVRVVEVERRERSCSLSSLPEPDRCKNSLKRTPTPGTLDAAVSNGFPTPAVRPQTFRGNSHGSRIRNLQTSRRKYIPSRTTPAKRIADGEIRCAHGNSFGKSSRDGASSRRGHVPVRRGHASMRPIRVTLPSPEFAPTRPTVLRGLERRASRRPPIAPLFAGPGDRDRVPSLQLGDAIEPLRAGVRPRPRFERRDAALACDPRPPRLRARDDLNLPVENGVTKFERVETPGIVSVS